MLSRLKSMFSLLRLTYDDNCLQCLLHRKTNISKSNLERGVVLMTLTPAEDRYLMDYGTPAGPAGLGGTKVKLDRTILQWSGHASIGPCGWMHNFDELESSTFDCPVVPVATAFSYVPALYPFSNPSAPLNALVAKAGPVRYGKSRTMSLLGL